MNNWDEQYAMHNVMQMNSMLPPVMIPHNFMVQDNTMNSTMKAPLIGPVLPVNQVEKSDIPVTQAEVQCVEAESSTQSSKRQSREHDQESKEKRDRRDRNRDRRHRSRSRDRNERRDRDDRRRHSKWDNDRDRSNSRPAMSGMTMGNMMIPGTMMAYNNMLTQQQMHMMPGLNIIRMVDESCINQAIPIHNQIIFPSGVLLPPIPGTSLPQRRERPKGCRTIVVGGLPNVKSDIVMEIFKQFGDIHVKSPRQGIVHVRFSSSEVMEQALFLTGYRFKFHEQADNEATTLFIDYAINREDEAEYEKEDREQTTVRVEQFTTTALTAIAEKIKSEEDFATAAPTLAVWLERGECNKRNANNFYSLIQASNNQLRRLFNEKMQLDEELQNLKTSLKDRFARVLLQFEQVAKILTAAKHQRVSDHFTKQQRRNVEMWLKMTEEVENIKEEFKTVFEDDDGDRAGSNKSMVSQEKYDKLKTENENLTYELEGYKNEAFLAKDEAERKFEKFKAHFIAQQAMQNQKVFPPLPNFRPDIPEVLKAPPPTIEDKVITSSPTPTDAKLISILTAFLMVHPLGATLDYLVSYVKSMTPNVTQATVLQILQKYTDVFQCKTSGVGATIEHRWSFITFDVMKTVKSS
ncbi:PREDICTED: ecto-NOX disulfide-thiol exchanger 2-like isoform X2 [Papilio polytes]|nr:PREDICTED: ecto-NOX disulfide-thiol exchanger 2-like isoform X2 [Papilio polytes]